MSRLIRPEARLIRLKHGAAPRDASADQTRVLSFVAAARETQHSWGRCRGCGLCGSERVAPVRGCVPRGNGHGDITLPHDSEAGQLDRVESSFGLSLRDELRFVVCPVCDRARSDPSQTLGIFLIEPREARTPPRVALDTVMAIGALVALDVPQIAGRRRSCRLCRLRIPCRVPAPLPAAPPGEGKAPERCTTWHSSPGSYPVVQTSTTRAAARRFFSCSVHLGRPSMGPDGSSRREGVGEARAASSSRSTGTSWHGIGDVGTLGCGWNRHCTPRRASWIARGAPRCRERRPGRAADQLLSPAGRPAACSPLGSPLALDLGCSPRISARHSHASASTRWIGTERQRAATRCGLTIRSTDPLRTENRP